MGSVDGFDSRYSIFSGGNVDIGTQNETFIDFRSISQLKTGSIIEFQCPGTNGMYADLSRSRLNIKLRILRSDLSPITKDDKVGLINNALSSIFKTAELKLQQQVVSPEISNLYPYKALLDTLLFKSAQYTESQAFSSLFVKDSAGYMDEVDIDLGGGNSGLMERWRETRDGVVCMLEGPLFLDAMEIKNYIPNGISIGLKLFPHENEFALMSEHPTEKYVIDITDIVLKIKYILPTPPLLLAHENALENSPALFPFIKSSLKSFAIPSGVNFWSLDSLFSDQIPETLLVTFVSSDAFSGSQLLNPYNFKNYSLSYLGFFVEGISASHTIYEPNFKEKQYTHEYLNLFNDRAPIGGIINKTDYPEGYTIYRINISQGVMRNYNSSYKQGQSRLTIRFSDPLPETVMCICYSRFPSILKIDKTRNIYL